MQGMDLYGSPLDSANRTGPEVNMYPGGASQLPGVVPKNGPGSSGMNLKGYVPTSTTPIDVFCGNVENNYKK